MKALKLYTGSILINFIPMIVMRLIMGRKTGDENMGYVVFGIFFIIALLSNISFFFIKTDSVPKNRIKNFLSYYLSSCFLFAFGTLLGLYESFANGINNLDILLVMVLCYSYFIINLLYVLYIKRRSISYE